MANLSVPQVTAFCDNYVRPVAEAMRALNARCEAMNLVYNSIQAQGHFANSADVIVDGRSATGVSVLTVNDVILLQSQIQTFIAQMDGGGVADVISKPCVRALEVL